MSITTTSEVLVDIGKAGRLDPTAVDRYDRLRVGVEAAVKFWLKWNVEQVVDQVDYYDGENQSELVLRPPFVRSVAGVWQDQTGFYGRGPSAFSADTALVEGQDWVLDYDDSFGGSGIGKSGKLVRIAQAATLLIMPSDIVYQTLGRTGLSYRGPPTWTSGRGNFKVQYTYGFTQAEMPADLKLAVSTAVSIIENTAKYGWPVQSENLPRYSYSLAMSREPEFGSVRDLLRRYRDVASLA